MSNIHIYNVYNKKTYVLDVSLPDVCTSCRVVLVDSKAYIFGGLNGKTYFDYILEHDLETNELTMLETRMPVGMSCFSIGVYQNNIFLFGGNGSDGGSSIYKFDLETKEFDTLETTIPHKIFKTGWCYVDKYLYVFGGTKGPRLTSIYRFNMETYELDLMSASMPYQISQSRCLYDENGHIYIFGGTNESNKLLKDVFKYNIEEDTLTLLDSKLEYETANAMVANHIDKDGHVLLLILAGNNDYSNMIYYLDNNQIFNYQN